MCTIDLLELYNSMPKRFFDPRIGKAAHAKVHKNYLDFRIQVLRYARQKKVFITEKQYTLQESHYWQRLSSLSINSLDRYIKKGGYI